MRVCVGRCPRGRGPRDEKNRVVPEHVRDATHAVLQESLDVRDLKCFESDQRLPARPKCVQNDAKDTCVR